MNSHFTLGGEYNLFPCQKWGVKTEKIGYLQSSIIRKMAVALWGQQRSSLEENCVYKV